MKTTLFQETFNLDSCGNFFTIVSLFSLLILDSWLVQLLQSKIDRDVILGWSFSENINVTCFSCSPTKTFAALTVATASWTQYRNIILS
jgi:hypothetical protein